jgi:ubiquinone/menaquinone biosynthesis C-methylase UbiE
MRRVVIPELLDSDDGTPAEIAASLVDLRRINAWFGGIGTLAELLRRVARSVDRRELSVLDVASGAGDVTRAAQQELAAEGLQIAITLMDRAATHLRNGNASVAGDARALPFRDGAFDVVCSTLFVHHLEPHEVTQFAREGLRVSRAAFVVNDLIRHPVHVALVYAGLPLFSRLTRHDAPASVRRAYTMAEMCEAIERAGARSIDTSRHYLFRMGVIAWK